MGNPNMEAAYDAVSAKLQAQEATSAEGMWYWMQDFEEEGRKKAAAEIIAGVLQRTPEAYRNPFITNALRDGVETTLGLKPLPQEGEL